MTETIDEFIARASVEPVDIKVSKLLEVWGERFRSFQNVARIRQDLSDAGLRCEPDIEKGGRRDTVRVGLLATFPSSTTGAASAPSGSPEDESQPDESLRLPDAALRVKDIPSALCNVARVRPDQSLTQACTIMSARSFSQVAVMTSDRELKGAVSWRSIVQAQIRLGKTDITLAEVTIPADEVSSEAELLSQLPLICEKDFIFVRSPDDDRVCGILTAADLTGKFGDLTTPYFQLGEFERRLRRCITSAFEPSDLQTAVRRHSAEDMEFGQYLELFDDEDRWKQMKWGIDRTMFIEYLDEARRLRNRVMHFGRELDSAERHRLVECLNFMRSLDTLP